MNDDDRKERFTIHEDDVVFYTKDGKLITKKELEERRNKSKEIKKADLK
jgi:transcription elongation factor